MNLFRFIKESIQIMIRGSKQYYIWLAFLFILIAWGSTGYIAQLKQGLIVTNMRDTISWAFYIGNFTFLVGVAAAAIMLVIPAYIYDWKPLKEVVIFGELLAIGFTTLIVLHAFIHIGVGLGLVPTTGLSLPLISYGRSNLLVTMASLGILMSIARAQPDRQPERKGARG